MAWAEAEAKEKAEISRFATRLAIRPILRLKKR